MSLSALAIRPTRPFRNFLKPLAPGSRLLAPGCVCVCVCVCVSVWSGPVIVLSCPVLSCHALACPVLSCPVMSCPVCPVLSCPVLSCPVLSCPAQCHAEKHGILIEVAYGRKTRNEFWLLILAARSTSKCSAQCHAENRGIFIGLATPTTPICHGPNPIKQHPTTPALTKLVLTPRW